MHSPADEISQTKSIKDPIKDRFEGKAPYIKYTLGDNNGLVGFLTEDDIQFVKETIKVINKHEVTWALPTFLPPFQGRLRNDCQPTQQIDFVYKF